MMESILTVNGLKKDYKKFTLGALSFEVPVFTH